MYTEIINGNQTVTLVRRIEGNENVSYIMLEWEFSSTIPRFHFDAYQHALYFFLVSLLTGSC